MPTEDTTDPAERRVAFGRSLADVLAVRDLTQRQFGELLGGISQPAISAWLQGESEPGAAIVFEAERVLELPPGRLSVLLGYLPPEAVDAPAMTFEQVVTSDPLLDDAAKRGLLAMYRELTSRRVTSRGGRPRKKA